MLKKKIHSTLHLIRKERRLTQEQVASQVGVTRQTIIAIEKGDYTPSVYLALALAAFFNIKVEEIFSLCKK